MLRVSMALAFGGLLAAAIPAAAADAPKTPTWAEMYSDLRAGTGKFTPTATPDVATLRPHTQPTIM